MTVKLASALNTITLNMPVHSPFNLNSLLYRNVVLIRTEVFVDIGLIIMTIGIQFLVLNNNYRDRSLDCPDVSVMLSEIVLFYKTYNITNSNRCPAC
jgi:hypothetical protein